jgi:hypothetical protein
VPAVPLLDTVPPTVEPALAGDPALESSGSPVSSVQATKLRVKRRAPNPYRPKRLLIVMRMKAGLNPGP